MISISYTKLAVEVHGQQRTNLIRCFILLHKILQIEKDMENKTGVDNNITYVELPYDEKLKNENTNTPTERLGKLDEILGNTNQI